MNDTKTIGENSSTAFVLDTLVTASPDYASFESQVSGLNDQMLSESDRSALTQDLMHYLRSAPEYSSQVETLLETTPPKRFDGGFVSIPVLVSVVFLLRSHIKIKRHPDGRWEFDYEHTQIDDELLTKLIDTLKSLPFFNKTE
jgi:hypothetical protein